MGLTVAVTGPTGEIGISAVTALEREPTVENIVGMARRPFDMSSQGWVKTIYLTTVVPATVRVKQLEEELDRSRATTPALAEAAARSEVEQLEHELSSTQAALNAATQLAATMGAAATPAGVWAGIAAAAAKRPWLAVLPLLAALGCGFWLGYTILARRIKRKFGGLKVY